MVAPRGTESLRQADKQKVGYLLGSTEAGITATAGGVQATARQLESRLNQLSVVATGGDAVKLPPGDIGMEVFIANDGAAAAQVFGSGTDTIDGVATATGVALTNATRCWYYCVSLSGAAYNWVSCKGVKST
jgi:hypothetical protein